MNIFYAPPEYVDKKQGRIALPSGEASHASKVLRYTQGDEIRVVDGVGHWYKGTVAEAGKRDVLVDIEEKQYFRRGQNLVLVMSIIKQRARLETAVEKAVELGASEIVLFNAVHTEKSKVRTGRLESIALSAMKQSLQCWLPPVKVRDNIGEVIFEYSGGKEEKQPLWMVAHEQGEKAQPEEETDLFGHRDIKKEDSEDNRRPLMVCIGPEGGFADSELEQLFNQPNACHLYFGKKRLRAETAAIAALSKLLPLRVYKK